MKKIKNLKFIMVFTLLFSIFTSNVFAASATVGFSGDSTVVVDNNITVKMYVSNVSGAMGGVVSVGGNLSFDSEYLEYVSGTGVNSPYSFQINPSASYKIAGLDTTLSNGITSQTTVFTFVFKAKKVGSTQVTLNNVKLSDTSSKMTASVVSKTITITEPQQSLSKDATLKSLGVDGYTLSPTFNSNTTSYTVTVPKDVTSVTVVGNANDSAATVTGLGAITLSGDSTTASIKVKAEDGTIKTYTIKINKEVTPDEPVNPEPPKNKDATLKSLGVDGYTLSPSFSSNTLSYTVTVPKDVTSVTVVGNANDSAATVTGLGAITLSGDSTTASIKVKAEDGTIKTYTIKIDKEVTPDEPVDSEKKDSDATLKLLDISGFTLNPLFNKNTTTYSIKVNNNITGLNVNAIANSDKATVTITGNSNWKEGINVVSVKVQAEDGTTNIYTINVTREAKTTPAVVLSSDNYLSNLIINSSHEINHPFDKNISNYAITVPNDVKSLDLKPILSNLKSSFDVVGNSNFKVGQVNTVEIRVRAEDGSIRIYTLNVTRSTDSSDNDLDDIIIKEGSLSPKFNPDVLDYTISVGTGVDKLTLTAIPTDDGSTVEVIGNENLKDGINTVLVKVTDKNGFSKYYQIQVDKEGSVETVFGLTPLQFGIILPIFTLLLLLLLFLLFRKKKEEQTAAPIIEVKPEFNFGSKNSSDDDVVHGNFNQSSDVEESVAMPKGNIGEARYEEIPYDPYDEHVTKEEIIDAIKEATATKDPSKLKMLLDQEALNQRKKELKEQEDNNEWR